MKAEKFLRPVDRFDTALFGFNLAGLLFLDDINPIVATIAISYMIYIALCLTYYSEWMTKKRENRKVV